MPVILLLILLFVTQSLSAQVPDYVSRKYHADSLKRWTTSTLGGISEKHPGFYRYTTKERFDHLIDSTTHTITDSLTTLDFYRKLKPLFSQIGCLHTGISLPEDYQHFLEKSPTFIPLEVFINRQGTVRITKVYDSKNSISVGSEIISINGKPMPEILNSLLRSIPSDGFNKTEKLLLLNHRFAFWYQTMVETAQTFTVVTKQNEEMDTTKLNGVSAEVFPALESLESNYVKPLEFEIVNGIGVFKIHSFAKSKIKSGGQNFRKFVKAAFRNMHEAGIKNLILDLRYNTGGTDGNAAYLASYFFDKPFRYWDRIEVTEATAKEIRGVYRIFYKKPKPVDGSYRWRKTWVTNEFDYYEVQKPAKNNFMGNSYVLTNGLCLSSCSDLVAILSDNKKVKVVGQETGGGYQGNTSGMMPSAEMPTGLRVTVPLQKYTNAVDPAKNIGHGAIPDYPVEPTFNDWVTKTDREMMVTLQLINNN